jgi:hypothetical protein
MLFSREAPYLEMPFVLTRKLGADMSNRLIVLGSSVFFALAGLATAASGAVIDTFSFSNASGWNGPISGFSGSFTGSVEANGRIELNAISARSKLLGFPPAATA